MERFTECQMTETRGVCQVCGFPTRHKRLFDDTWLCEACSLGESDDIGPEIYADNGEDF